MTLSTAVPTAAASALATSPSAPRGAKVHAAASSTARANARRVTAVETFIVTLPRDTPYLGPLGPGEEVNARGYIVRKGNGTIYPTVDRSIAVRVTTDDGAVGWGETYGICAPRATCEIINELLAPVLLGRDPEDVEAIWDDLYGLMRVRGCGGGFHGDALAALDIALWDLRARGRGLPLSALLSDAPLRPVPGYLSGLPAATLAERVQLACAWQAAGITAFKFAAVVSHEGVAEEFAALRAALGPDADIMVDLHWKYGADEAIALAAQLAPLRPRFLEAPVKPEAIAELAQVCATWPGLIAAGEEWYSRRWATRASRSFAASPRWRPIAACWWRRMRPSAPVSFWRRACTYRARWRTFGSTNGSTRSSSATWRCSTPTWRARVVSTACRAGLAWA
jgi:hypothetical protein